MIEMTAETPPTLKTVDELFEALSRLIGRTIMVHHPGRKGSPVAAAHSPARTTGRLDWLGFSDGGSTIAVSMGRPQFGDYAKLPVVGIHNRISVLADDVWTVVHQPAEYKM